MKYFKVLICFLLIALMFSGCGGLSLASSVDDLISPVSQSGENAKIQNAVNNYRKGGYSVKIPAFGEYTTAYIYYDINGDGTDEALAFYEPNDSLGNIEMAVLKKDENDEWVVVTSIEGSGTDVYSVDFCDINGDGEIEFLISWNMISNSTAHVLSVYRGVVNEDGKYGLVSIADDIIYSGYVTVDMTDDGFDELLVFAIDQSKSVTASAKLYSLKNNKKKLLGETRVDGHVIGYRSFKIGSSDSGIAVYADAVKSNGASMVTEMIYWSNYYNSIVSPFYSYSKGITAETTRKVMVESCDINGDGVIEIPLDTSLDNMPNGVRAVDWKIYKKSVLVHSAYSLAVDADRYHVVIPDDYFKKVTVLYDENQKTLTVATKGNDKNVFSIIPVLKSYYKEDSPEYQDYEQIMDESGYIYLARVYENEVFQVTKEQLKDIIKAY